MPKPWRRCGTSSQLAEETDYLQKPSMHTLGEAHALPAVGSHSLPRLVEEPHTEKVFAPEAIDLQTLNESDVLQSSSPASALHAM